MHLAHKYTKRDNLGIFDAEVTIELIVSSVS